ncbi:MAG: phage holin family protein [Candidatus Binatia bacterium]
MAAPPAEPSAISAAERAVEAAQRIAVERLELMRLELVDGLSDVVKRAGAVLAAGFVAILGWTGLAIALAVVLSDYMPAAASIAIVGGLHLLIGLLLAVWAGTNGQGRKSS